MGFSFGVMGDANQQCAVDWAVGNGAQIARWRERLPARWDELAQPGSELDALLATLPEAPVDLRRTLFEALWTSHCCLEEVLAVVRDGAPGSAPAVLSNLRTALLASARMVYVLLPDVAGVQWPRLERATDVLVQEARSLGRVLKNATEYRMAYINLLPPQAEVDDLLIKIDQLCKGRPNPPGDERMLARMAEVSQLVVSQQIGAPGADLTRDLRWLFNAGSGIAHGYGWPSLMWMVGSFHTNAPGDLMLTSIIVDHAHQLVLEQSGIGLG